MTALRKGELERLAPMNIFVRKPVPPVEAYQYVEYGKLVKGMCNSISCFTAGNNQPHVHTIHKEQIVNLEVGDWILPEPNGKNFYPVKADIFENTYQPASNAETRRTVEGECQPPAVFSDPWSADMSKAPRDGTQELIRMARAAQHDERLSDGALYGKLADALDASLKVSRIVAFLNEPDEAAPTEHPKPVMETE